MTKLSGLYLLWVSFAFRTAFTYPYGKTYFSLLFGDSFPEENVAVDNTFLTQGDILMDVRRNAVREHNTVWLRRVVPFTVDTVFPASTLEQIRLAIQEIEQFSCVRFQPRQNEIDYIRIRNISGCYSPVGRRGGPQDVSIGNGCESQGTIIHELMHALGFWHEHTRPDRDLYITIIKENIAESHTQNFQKMTFDEVDTLGAPYDYGSIMHYALNAFAVDRSKWTMIPKLPTSTEIGQRKHLSKIDIYKLNKLYNCNISHCQRLSTPLHGFKQGDDYSVGKVVYFFCQTGFVLVGSSERFCKDTGDWTGNNPCLLTLSVFSGGGDGGSAVRFWYHMFGSSMGELRVYLRIRSRDSNIFSIRGDQGKEWRVADVVIKSTVNFQIVIEAISGPSFRSDIAIDDILITTCTEMQEYKRLLKNTIQKSISQLTGLLKRQRCNFDDDLCGWTQEQNDIFDWTHHYGPTTTIGTGPSCDRTNCIMGKYLYIEASAPRMRGDYSAIYSPVFQVVFEGVRGYSFKSDMAFDDFTLDPGYCIEHSVTCDFQRDLCSWIQDTRDKFEWIRHSGPTGTPGTGPNTDHSGTNGYYLYIETSAPRIGGDVARIMSPVLPPVTGGYCFEMAYFMFGSHVSMLTVSLRNHNRETILWIRSGNIGPYWNITRIGFSVSESSQLIIAGVVGESYRSDIAIDDTVLTRGPC
ncbi:and LDL-receptor class A domain-containing 1-like isoform X2 [Octopus vulgaris]|uniref:Metalloendopeptidase n=1 Tax=Octopus vulgaris TaxID=6645 RepID=A0AA36B380_OCTVU|nr:and LDL-receptor class A domain-containing 1-like isoform X2 [Octopus vulgaris]